MKRRHLILLAILLVGGWLRFQSLDAKCLWLDEAISWRLARYPLPEVVKRSAHPFEGSPPLYYVLLSLWAAVAGDSEFALRSPSAAAGLATVLGMYCFVRELTALGPPGSDRPPHGGATWPAPLAAALTAVSVLQIHNARQVRMYSTAAALLAWGGWALLKGLRRGRGAGAFWLLYAVLALAACYTHTLAPLTVAAQLLFAVVFLSAASWTRPPGRGSERRPLAEVLRPWAWPSVAVLVIAVGYAPWVGAFREKAEEAGRNYWMGPLSLSGVLKETFAATAGPFPAPWPAQAAGGLAAILLLAAAFVSFARGRRGWAGAYLLATALAPAGLMLGYSAYSGRSLFHSRYLSFVQLDWLASLAVFVAGLGPRLRTAAAVGGAFLWGLVLLPCSWGLIGPAAEPGMRGAFEYVASRRRPGDIVVAQNSFTFLPASYYGRHEARPVLFSEVPSRQLQAAAPFLDDGDLVTPHQLIDDGPTGLWWVSSSSYGDRAGVGVHLPGVWLATDREEFGQDNAWEGPVVVETLRKD